MSSPDSDRSSREQERLSPPLLGALLRLAHQAMSQELARWLGESDHADLQPAHCAAIQALWVHPGGARLTDLARTARMTKQSMGALVDHLERTGYVQRMADPGDRRAARVDLTGRGIAFTEAVRAFVREVEADWARRVGDRRMRDLQETLARLVVESAPRRPASRDRQPTHPR